MKTGSSKKYGAVLTALLALATSSFFIAPKAEAKSDQESTETTQSTKSTKETKSRKSLSDDIEKLENVSYMPGLPHADDRAHLFCLYTPKAKAEKSFPLIIYVHGGGWTTRPNSIPRWVPNFVRKGYGVAIVYYRLAQEGIFSSQIEDLNTALRYFKGNADKLHIDANHIGLWGSSAGGHLVALMGASANSPALDIGGDKSISRDVQAVCDFAGPANLYDLGTKQYPKMEWDTVSPTSSLSLLLGGTAASQKARALEASPDTYISPGDPPFLVIHGEADKLVPIEQSDDLVAALQKAGVDTTYIRLPHEGHHIEHGKNIETARKFFDKHLKGDTH